LREIDLLRTLIASDFPPKQEIYPLLQLVRNNNVQVSAHLFLRIRSIFWETW